MKRLVRRVPIPELVRNLLVGLFRENLLYKVLSLVLAVGLWAYLQGEQVVEESAWAKVEYALPGDLVVTQAPTRRVRVTVQGAQAFVKNVRRAELVVEVDVQQLEAGVHNIDFVESQIDGVPDNVKVVGLVPNSVQLELEPKRSVTVPVEPVVVGEPPKGYRVSSITLDPVEVLVEGAASAITSLDSVVTEGIQIGSMRASTRKEVQLNLPKGVIKADQTPVTAEVVIEAVTAQRTFTEVPVVLRDRSWSTPQESVRVTLSGPVEPLEAMQLDEITVLVHVAAEVEGGPQIAVADDSRPVHFEVAHRGGEEIEVESVEPSRIEILPLEAP